MRPLTKKLFFAHYDQWKNGWVVDSVRSREPSPCGIAFGDSILPVSNR